MGIDRDFYHFASGIDSACLGAAIGANEITGPLDLVVTDIASFDRLGPAMLGYLEAADAARQQGLRRGHYNRRQIDQSNSCLVVDRPRIGFARAAAIMAKPLEDSYQTTGISPSAIIAAGAKIHPAATIMAGLTSALTVLSVRAQSWPIGAYWGAMPDWGYGCSIFCDSWR